MSLNTFDKTQTQYERKMARQKQLDMMEAAASGQVDASSMSARSTPNSQSRTSPHSATGSARRFLWDADEEEYKNVPSRAFAGGGAGEPDQVVNLMGGRPSSSVLPRFSATTGMETTKPSANIAPRRGSAWHSDAATSIDAEEYLEDVRFGRSQRGGLISCIGDCCIGTLQTLIGACAILAEYVTGLCRCSKKSWLMLGALLAMAVFIGAIVAIVKRTTGGSDSYPAPQVAESIQDPLRYNAIRDVILESGFTDPTHLDTEGTAQNLAVRWLTDDDPARVEVDDDALLQRYALATFFFSTYVSTEYKDAFGTDDLSRTDNNTDDFEWNHMDHWMTDKGICMWYGVTCPPHLHEGLEKTQYNDNNDILHLNLTDNNIQGTLPSELVALENLITLDVGRNRLEGTIPVSITNLKYLGESCVEYMQNESGVVIVQ